MIQANSKQRLFEIMGKIDPSFRIKENFFNSNEIYYHGSNNKFNEFELFNNKAYKEFDIPVWYFTKDLDYAKTYGKYIYEVKLKINKTFNTLISEHYDLFLNYLKQENVSDSEIDSIFDEQFYKDLPYWTCEDAYYCAKYNKFDSILIQEELDSEVHSIGVFDKENIEIVNVISDNHKLNESKYTPQELGQFIYHQTNYNNAINILKNGFKTGYELDKGEKNSGIFFSPTDKGQENVVYNRGKNNKLAMVEVSTNGLNLLDTSKLPTNQELLSFQQEWYKLVRNAKEKNIFPDGYEGILHHSQHDSGIYEIILKQDAANKNMTGRIKNLRGQYIEIINVALNNSKLNEYIVYNSQTFYHGSTDKNLEGKNGIHVGTKLAATQALEARIGVPAEGEWDGAREYGKTLLAGKKTLAKPENKYKSSGYNCCSDDIPEDNYLPSQRKKRAAYSDNTPIPFDCKPIVFPVKIIGNMTNIFSKPHSDSKANGLMKRNLKMGNAKSGYYYVNDGEDSGSISAVVPNKTFLKIL